MLVPNGISAFPITPSTTGGHIDASALRRVISRLANAKVDSIGLLGSTGTYMYLTREERRKAIEITLSEVPDTLPVIVGIGALRTDEVVKLARDAKSIGAKAGLLAPVSYTPLTEDEVFEHYAKVASEGGLPIIIYDNPGTTHFQFTLPLVARLAKIPGVVGIKNPAEDAATTNRHLLNQRSIVPKNFSIGYSRDWNSVEAMIAGADVWYSVIAGIFPEVCINILNYINSGDLSGARQLNNAISPILGLIEKHSGVRVAYAAMQILGVCNNQPPAPILSLPKEVINITEKAILNLSKEVISI